MHMKSNLIYFIRHCTYIIIEETKSNSIPEGNGKGRPLIKISQVGGQVVKEVVIAPVENGALFDTEAAAVALVGCGGVGVGLLELHGLVEELAPHLLSRVHELRPHAVVHHLKEPPLAARLRHMCHRRPIVVVEAPEVDQRNVHRACARALLEGRP